MIRNTLANLTLGTFIWYHLKVDQASDNLIFWYYQIFSLNSAISQLFNYLASWSLTVPCAWYWWFYWFINHAQHAKLPNFTELLCSSETLYKSIFIMFLLLEAVWIGRNERSQRLNTAYPGVTECRIDVRIEVSSQSTVETSLVAWTLRCTSYC